MRVRRLTGRTGSPPSTRSPVSRLRRSRASRRAPRSPSSSSDRARRRSRRPGGCVPASSSNQNAFFTGTLADVGRFRVPDLRSEGRRQGGRPLDPIRAHVAIRLNALHTFVGEHSCSVRENAHGQQTLNAMTGIITFSSSCPCSDAMATVVSQPITWKHT